MTPYEVLLSKCHPTQPLNWEKALVAKTISHQEWESYIKVIEDHAPECYPIQMPLILRIGVIVEGDDGYERHSLRLGAYRRYCLANGHKDPCRE